jgi:MFS family permease
MSGDQPATGAIAAPRPAAGPGTLYPGTLYPGTLYRALFVFLPFALGYFLSYLFRTVNAVIADELAASLGVTAAGLGLLTSAYFITFGLFQAPLGLLLDRFGPRRVEAALLLVAAGGAAVFAMGDTLGLLAVGRGLIGLGVSACLMAALTANVAWWPSERLPLINGLFMASGGLGAVFATTPVRALLTVTDWRGVFAGLSVATVAVAAIIAVVVPDRHRPGGQSPPDWAALLRGTRAVYASGRFWRLAPASVMMQGGFMAYISLWAGPWLRDVSALPRAEVAGTLQYAAMAMVAGFAGFGLCADALSRRGVPPAVVWTTGMALAVGMQAALVLDLPLPPTLVWVLVAFFATASVMSYTILAQGFPAAMAGRVVTSVNLLMFVMAFALQTGIGAIIDRFPTPPAGGYAPAGHHAALALVVTLQAAALAWQVWPRQRP